MTDPLGFAKVSHAFSGFDECYAFDVSTEEAPIDFLNSKKDALSGLLSSKIDEFKNIKVIACLHPVCKTTHWCNNPTLHELEHARPLQRRRDSTNNT